MGHFARECRSSSYNQQPGNPSNPSYNRHQGTQGSAHFVPTHYIQAQAPPPQIQYVPQVQYVQMPPQPQGQQPPIAAQTASTPQPAHQSFFTLGYVDWSSLPNDMSDSGHDMGAKIFDVNWSEPETSQQNFALMAFEGSTSSVVSQVSQESLKKLCSSSCIEAFALIRETNVYLNSQLNNLEHKHCKKTNELEKKLTEKTKEVSKLTNNAIDMKAQINLMVDNLGKVRQELADTKVNCATWVESCKGYQMLLNKQSASNVKFGIGYNHTEPPIDFTPKTSEEGSENVQVLTSEDKESDSSEVRTTSDDYSSDDKTSDISPAVVTSTSGVENLITTEDKNCKCKDVRKVPSNKGKSKGKAKACEVCGLFNHTTEFCRYRKGKQFNRQVKQMAQIEQGKKNFKKTFVPQNHVPIKTFSKDKTVISQQQSKSTKQNSYKYYKNTYSEVRPKPLEVSQTSEVKYLINMVQLLMTKVSGKHKNVSATAPKRKPKTKMAWVPKIGQTLFLFLFPRANPRPQWLGFPNLTNIL